MKPSPFQSLLKTKKFRFPDILSPLQFVCLLGSWGRSLQPLETNAMGVTLGNFREKNSLLNSIWITYLERFEKSR